MTKYIEEHNFTFDLSYDETTTNETIYLDAVRPMIEAAFNKTKVTCFAYGQTGSGKTFTMMGPGTNALETGAPGLYLLSAFDIFSLLENECYNHLEIWVSFYEIYCGKLYDLLNERGLLTAREDGKQNICIVGLTEKQVTSLSAMMQLIEYGLKVRTVGVTGANSDSSRSHGIIQISIKESNGNPHGKISFIDLAGSERAADTIDTNKQTKIDGAEINKSLLALKECIRALDQDKKYTPFRGSKLTLVLRDSFMGNCKTLMIANISPGLSSSEHTLNTLRYADRVKELRREKERVDTNLEPVSKDPYEQLSNILMMPRQHGKTVKYNVDKNLNPIRNSTGGNNLTHSNSFSYNNLNKVPQKKINIINSLPPNNIVSSNNTSHTKSNTSTNNFVVNKENTNNNVENQLFNLLNKPKIQSIPHNNNNFNNNVHNTSNGFSNTNNFLNNYNAFTKQRNSYFSQNESNVSKSPGSEMTEEELQRLSEKHEKLISKILAEEEGYIENHRKHVDNIVEIIKDVKLY